VSLESDSVVGAEIGFEQIVDNVYDRADLFAMIAPHVLEMEREDFDASLVAAACVYVARKGTGIYPIWPKHLQVTTGQDSSTVKRVA
jgi:hypothetical protein